MDRELSQHIVQQQQFKQWRLGLIILGIIALSVWGVRRVFFTAVKQSDLRIVAVESGPVENTLSAVGELIPAFEQLITSPIPAVIQRVFCQEGTAVKVGDKLIELDRASTQLDYEKQKDQLDLRRNGIIKLRLDLDKSFYDLQISDSIKAFRIEALKADIESARRLFKAGGGTREAVEKLENDLHIARLEKRQLENDIRTRQAITKASIRESEISAAIQEKELSAFQRKLDKSDIRASHPGVLTYINKNLGQQVAEGEPLARVADLSDYKILASISDNYAGKISTGMPVLVRINNTDATGIVTNIHPSIVNNVMTFELALTEKNVRDLRPKMKVEVYLVTERRAQTLRVANGPAFKGGSELDLFVLRPDGIAERRRVKTGLVNFDYVEILDGLSIGEKVIISDMSKYKNSNEIKIIPGSIPGFK